ncbi:MAG: Fur family transcriptional regulator [Anaerolineae bacterium]
MSINPEARDMPLARRLRHHGYRLTKPRLAVLETLEAGPHHLSPSEVFERAKEVYPSLGLTTVYRTLELLTELGTLRTSYMGDAAQRYHNSGEGHHDHCVCSACGRVMEIDECHLEAVVELIEQKTGFQIEGHFLELYGRCPGCRSMAGSESTGKPEGSKEPGDRG